MPDYTSIHTGPVIDQGVSEGLTAVQPGDLATVATSGDYTDLINIPATFVPSAHNHVATDITDFNEAVGDAVNGLLVQGTNVTFSYNDVANTFTINAAGTNLAYTAATRLLTSDTGTDVTLPLVTSGDAGLAPASGGGTTNFLRADGTWAAPGGGGGSGDVVGPASATDNAITRFDTTTGKLIQDSGVLITDTNELTLPVVASPATPATDTINLFARKLAGKVMLGTEDQLGREAQLQPMLGTKSVFYCSPANSTTGPTTIGGVLSTVATISHQQTIASANPWQATRRTRFQTNTTAGNATGARTAYVQWFRGNAAGFGGFYFRGQVGMNINLNGGQKFFGLCALTTLLAGDPSALLNMCGMGYDAGDASTGNWFFMRNDGAGTATKVDLGTNAARNTNNGYDLIMYNPPNSGDLFVRIVNLHSGVLVLDTSYNTDLPAVNTGMAYKCDVRNGAVAAADNIEVANVYIESELTR